MSSYVGIHIRDQSLQSQLMQFNSLKNQNGKVMAGDLPPLMVKLKAFREMYSEEEIRDILSGLDSDFSDDIDLNPSLRSDLHFTSVPLIPSNLKLKCSSLPHRALISHLSVEFRPATGPPPHHTIISDSPAFLPSPHSHCQATAPSRNLSLSGNFLSHHRTLDPAPAPNPSLTLIPN